MQPERIDFLGTHAFMDKYHYCAGCDLQAKISSGERCDDCPYTKASDRGKDTYRAALSRPIADSLGFLTEDHVGRTDLEYIFRQHPELNGRMPVLPRYNIFGELVTATDYWEKHHLYAHYDDRFLIRVLKSEHGTIEAMQRRGVYTIIIHLLRTREIHPDLEPGPLFYSRETARKFNSQFERKNGVWSKKKYKRKKFRPLILNDEGKYVI